MACPVHMQKTKKHNDREFLCLPTFAYQSLPKTLSGFFFCTNIPQSFQHDLYCRYTYSYMYDHSDSEDFYIFRNHKAKANLELSLLRSYRNCPFVFRAAFASSAILSNCKKQCWLWYVCLVSFELRPLPLSITKEIKIWLKVGQHNSISSSILMSSLVIFMGTLIHC